MSESGKRDQVDREALLTRYYKELYVIRRFEERLLDLFETGILSGTTHACIGQEAGCVGIIDSLRTEDLVFSNHRCHGHFLAKTGNISGLLDEILGRSTGVCGGRGGSQHLCADGFLSNGILGGTIPSAAGLAWAEKLNDTDRIIVVFVGDGALGEGVVYETLNLVALWRLPLLIVVENNEWSQSTPRRENMSGEIAPRLSAFSLRVTESDTNDVEEIAQSSRDIVQRIRHSGEPEAMVLHTYRFCHHSKNDDSRPIDEIEARRSKDPIVVLGERLQTSIRRSIESRVDEELGLIFEAATQQGGQ